MGQGRELQGELAGRRKTLEAIQNAGKLPGLLLSLRIPSQFEERKGRDLESNGCRKCN
jgi:hypothetical protein